MSAAATRGPAGGGVASAASALGPLVLEARGLSKQFRIQAGAGGTLLSAVRGVSLELYRSAVVALVGESGSGKSTVAKLLAGQEVPSGGEILLDGQSVTPSSRREFRRYKRHVQLLFQDPFASLNPVHKVRYPLERAVRLHQRGHSRVGVGAELVRLLEEVHLTPAEQFLGRYPHELSGGQRQRVAIARALAVRPRVLLADEPVSMLDVSIRLEVLDVLDTLRRRFELSVLYITHDIASARYFADETLVMYAGEIVERGPSEELTQHPAHPYSQLLLAAAPDPDRLGVRVEERILRGSRRTPLAAAATSGCRFSARCPFADARCAAEAPPLLPLGAQRAAACWRLDVAAPELAVARDRERCMPMST